MTILPSTNPYLTQIKKLADTSLERDDLLRDLINIHLCTLAFEGLTFAIDILDASGVVMRDPPP